ncbi:MAG: DUF4890 domain-containing protein [Prevotella sp.]
MKRIFMIMFAAIMACTATFAQEQSEKGNDRKAVDQTQVIKMRTEAMVKQLGLNEVQADSLLALNTEFADKFPGMRGNRGQGGNRRQGGERPSREEMQKRMQEGKAAMEAYNARLKNILTEEQMTKYTELQKSRMQRGGNRQGGTRGQGGNRPANDF